MVRRGLCWLLVVGLLAGCAVLGSPLENPEVVEARRSAADALDRAREHGAPDHRPQPYRRARTRFSDLSDTEQRRGIEELVRGFNQVEILAHEATVGTLEDRVEKLRSTMNQDLKEARGTVEELRGSLARLRSQHDTAQRRLARARQELNRKSQNLEELQRENREIARKMQEAVKEAEVRRERQRVYLTLESRILFDLGKAELKPDARETLRKVAGVLNQYPDRDVRVEGHTDDLAITGRLKDVYPTNWELSARRATNVVRYLIDEQGVDPNRLAAMGFGQYRPRVPNDSEENRQKNRRVEIVLMPEKQPVKTLDPEADTPAGGPSGADTGT